MIKRSTEVLRATCDACSKSLLEPSKLPDQQTSLQYAKLEPHFGYGSVYDTVGMDLSLDVCSRCWTKTLRALGLRQDVDQFKRIRHQRKAER